MTMISAEPTKEFFINMLTRDISLLSALVDLIDNSVDAAKANSGLEDKRIDINLDKDGFFIKDNCGGISKRAAEQYAFKFGRPSNAPTTAHSVGRFGVGMKRALFKMGEEFTIKSKHRLDSFLINVRVQDWMSSPNDWNFNLNDTEIDGEYGTSIEVTSLHQSIAEKFDDNVFVNSLRAMIGKSHFRAINEGLSIYVNEVLVDKKDILIKTSNELGIVAHVFDLKGVSITIKAGIGERNIHEGGWYVFCNDRMIEESSKTSMTGWGVDGIRAYHADVAFFRGVIEFKSEDGAKLPWNTTKTGIDTDNPIYRTALIQMKLAMRKVIALLNDRLKEQEAVDSGRLEDSQINRAILDAELTSIFSTPPPQTFIRPKFEQPPRQTTERRIAYSVKETELNSVKESLGVTTNKDVGLFTFKYYLDNEC